MKNKPSWARFHVRGKQRQKHSKRWSGRRATFQGSESFNRGSDRCWRMSVMLRRLVFSLGLYPRLVRLFLSSSLFPPWVKCFMVVMVTVGRRPRQNSSLWPGAELRLSIKQNRTAPWSLTADQYLYIHSGVSSHLMHREESNDWSHTCTRAHTHKYK